MLRADLGELRLRDELAKCLIAAAIASRPPRTTRTGSRQARVEVKAIPAGKTQTQAIRDWAKTAGHEVSTLGTRSAARRDGFERAVGNGLPTTSRPVKLNPPKDQEMMRHQT